MVDGERALISMKNGKQKKMALKSARIGIDCRQSYSTQQESRRGSASERMGWRREHIMAQADGMGSGDQKQSVVAREAVMKRDEGIMQAVRTETLHEVVQPYDRRRTTERPERGNERGLGPHRGGVDRRPL